jgi:glycosyltransferase involved in cell wall biosynthesis
MKKTIFATHVKFWLEEKGSSKRIASLLKYMSESKVKTYVYYAGFIDENGIRLISEKYPLIELYADNYEKRLKRNKFLKKTTTKILSSISPKYKYGTFMDKLQPRGFAGKYAYYRKGLFNGIVQNVNPDSIIIEYLSLAYLIEDIYSSRNGKPLLLIDTHDILYLRNQSFRATGLRHWVDISKEKEIEYLGKFDVIIAIQSTEKKMFQEILPEKRVIDAPYPYFVHPHEQRNAPAVRIGYIGTASPENKDAIASFIDNVWMPLKGKYGQSITFGIYGKISDALETYRNIEGLTIYGKFDDLKQVYANLDIVVNPVRSGGGLKIKNIEALCHSLPLVTTPCGAQGLEGAVNDAFVCCESYSEQIDMISELVDNKELRIRFSDRAHQYAMDNFREEKCYRELLNIVG